MAMLGVPSHMDVCQSMGNVSNGMYSNEHIYGTQKFSVLLNRYLIFYISAVWERVRSLKDPEMRHSRPPTRLKSAKSITYFCKQGPLAGNRVHAVLLQLTQAIVPFLLSNLLHRAVIQQIL